MFNRASFDPRRRAPTPAGRRLCSRTSTASISSGWSTNFSAHYREGPSLHRARQSLRNGELLDRRKVEQLPGAAKSDADARDEQHRLQRAYLDWRDATARQMARNSGPLGRLTRSREEFFPQIDRERLNVCGACREIVFPATGKNSVDQMPTPCHYCRKREWLTPYGENTDRTGGAV